ncbi:MAG: SMC-Scp complex subunit ScpB [Vampirovibrionales bacterium]|nr:SMC-Scp complex subunit ScpB [Vampirovibrionales bacterium]
MKTHPKAGHPLVIELENTLPTLSEPSLQTDNTEFVRGMAHVDPVSTSLKGRVEAMLFLTSVPLSAATIAERLGAQLYAVEDALMDLIADYNGKDDSSALEIDDSDGYILQVKTLYSNEVRQMVPMDLSHGVLRTLSAIAIKAPVKQSALVDLRGSSAYDHISELVAKKLVSRRKQGRSYILDVTPAFQAHFKLSGNKAELAHLLEVSHLSQQMAQAMASQESHSKPSSPGGDPLGT